MDATQPGIFFLNVESIIVCETAQFMTEKLITVARRIGYVTVDQGLNKLACIHTPDGSGICWPGGKSGYNKAFQD